MSVPQALTGPGALTLTTKTTLFTPTAVGNALSLANGLFAGQRKTVVQTAAVGTGVITPATPGNFASVTIAARYGYAELEWSGAAWNLVNQGVIPSVGPLIVAAAAIAPSTLIAHVTGATIITTITPPWVGFIGDVTLIPDDVGGFTTDTGGNIAKATAAPQFRALSMTYDGTLWYPSYF